MAERSHLSIGEVLSLLREEFPDVTISKIRFLESQGLVDPERTPSGYRKFYDQDVERLRWILRQQREHFLPLKVIRGRLSEHPDEPAANGATPEEGADEPGSGSEAPTSSSSPAHPAATTATTPTSRPAPSARVPAREGRRAGRSEEPATLPGLGAETGEAAPAPAEAPSPHQTAAAGVEADSYTAEELAVAAGTTPGLVNELKQYGLISIHAVVAGTAYFDRSSLDVTKAAAGFALHGVEARHLRAWRNSADREAALFEQLVMPLLRQRNPQARRQAAEMVSDLSRLGGELRAALLERALREIR
ncbi:MAG TPA: MerR family transcriptional regulator [Acidimicrobiales bacterium]|nr:MerR family transcriptional regulator [Acidimicrobiales bacterium]